MTGRARRAQIGLAATGLAAVLVLAGGGPVFADPDGRWFESAYGVGDAHTQGLDGSGVNIAVIGPQIDTSVPALQGVNLTVSPVSECFSMEGVKVDPVELGMGGAHEASVVEMILGNGAEGGPVGIAPGAHVTFYSIGKGVGLTCSNAQGTSQLDASDQARGAKDHSEVVFADQMIRAVDDGADIISMSWAGTRDISDADASLVGIKTKAIREAVLYAQARGVIIVASVANESDQPDCIEQSGPVRSVPWGYNGVLAISSVGPDGNLAMECHSDRTAFSAPGAQMLMQSHGSSNNLINNPATAGNSLATPWVAGAFALVKQKFPDVTNDQLIQLAARNTLPGGSPDGTGPVGPHEPVAEGDFGFGIMDVAGMLADDPSQYPDENPNIFSGDELPTSDEIKAAKQAFTGGGPDTPTGSTSAPTGGAGSSTNPGSGSGSGSSSSPGWLWPVVGGGVLIIGLLVTLVVVMARKKPAPSPVQAPMPGGYPPSGYPQAQPGQPPLPQTGTQPPPPSR